MGRRSMGQLSTAHASVWGIIAMGHRSKGGIPLWGITPGGQPSMGHHSMGAALYSN
jgi:hypothetical protein